MTVLSSDRPGTDPSQDLFGHASFAKHLAASICRIPAPEGLVISLYGPWGSGKTTTLNYVQSYVNAMPEAERPIVVSFNPWWFSGHEDLARAFLRQLQATLSERGAVFENIVTTLAAYADAIGATVNVIKPGIGTVVKSILARFKDSPQSISTLKIRVAEALRQSDQHILLIIDDIDRLIPDEIRQLFTVIKGLADFPNVIYLLSFDRAMAVKAIATQTGLSGDAFLEKIIQVPFELPLVNHASLCQVFLANMNAIVVEHPPELFDSSHWATLFHFGISPFIKTPRDVTRLTNTISVTYPAVRGEVNVADFIAIETIRVFLPSLYGVIRSNPDQFIGHNRSDHNQEVESLKTFHGDWLKEIPEETRREGARNLTRTLFPKLESAWSNTRHDATWEPKWRKSRRICSDTVFPVYFRLAVPASLPSHTEMKALIANGAYHTLLRSALLAAKSEILPSGTSKIQIYLKSLPDYIGDIDGDYIQNFVGVLLDIGDDIIGGQDESAGLLTIGSDMQISALIIVPLLRRISPPERRQAILAEAIKAGEALYMETFLVKVLQAEFEKPSAPGEPLIDQETLISLQDAVLAKLEKSAESGRLRTHNQLDWLLARWLEWGEVDKVKNWVERNTKSDADLIAFLTRFGKTAVASRIGSPVRTPLYRLNPKWLEPYMDISGVAERLQELLRDVAPAGDESTSKAIHQFLIEYDMLQRGEDPDMASVFASAIGAKQ